MFNLFTVFSLVVSLDLPKTHNTASYRKFINCIKELSLCIISLYCSAWLSFCLSIYCLIYIICFVCFAISLRLYSYGQRVFVKDTEILNKKKCTIFPAYSLVLEVQGVPPGHLHHNNSQSTHIYRCGQYVSGLSVFFSTGRYPRPWWTSDSGSNQM